MTELLANFAAGRWQTGNGPGTALSDPVLGDALGDVRVLRDGDAVKLGKEPVFLSQHLQVPTRGVALFINAFNFPAWGLWEKAAPALLSGVPVIVKPATATAWLTQRMVKDVIDAGVLPAATVGSDAFNLLVREVVREMTVKSGQKCTAIRRILVPAAVYDAAAEAIGAKLAGISVGNPRNESVRMGSLVSAAQLHAVREGLAALSAHTDLLHDGRARPLVDADPAVAACMGPGLLGARDADAASAVHDMEVFGPVATLLPYRDLDHALALAHRGQGSLVTSLFGADEAALAAAAVQLAASHWRVHVVTPDVAQAHTGHGNVMPMSQHGGPGRAGGGAELGG